MEPKVKPSFAPKHLTAEAKQAFIDHIRAEMATEELKVQMLGYWVSSLVENSHLYPEWFKEP